MRARRVVGIATAVTIALVPACSSDKHRTISPRAVPLPHIRAWDPPAARAGKLARYIEARWPRIRVAGAHSNADGTMVTFNDSAAFDHSIDDAATYEASVRTLTDDLAQASVELLKLSLHYFPDLQYASVWQDRQLQALWSREDIVAMDRPEAYHDYQSFLKLVFTARYPPFGATPPPAPSS